MKTSELGPFWLRDAADDLRTKALRVEKNPYTGFLSDICLRVAAKYRKAATLLDDAAVDLEEELSTTISVRDDI